MAVMMVAVAKYHPIVTPQLSACWMEGSVNPSSSWWHFMGGAWGHACSCLRCVWRGLPTHRLGVRARPLPVAAQRRVEVRQQALSMCLLRG
jgi:hypothetical protein